MIPCLLLNLEGQVPGASGGAILLWEDDLSSCHRKWSLQGWLSRFESRVSLDCLKVHQLTFSCKTARLVMSCSLALDFLLCVLLALCFQLILADAV